MICVYVSFFNSLDSLYKKCYVYLTIVQQVRFASTVDSNPSVRRDRFEKTCLCKNVLKLLNDKIIDLLKAAVCFKISVLNNN